MYNGDFDLPGWVRWIATDADGAVWAYEVEPLLHDTGWYLRIPAGFIRYFLRSQARYGHTKMKLGEGCCWGDKHRMIVGERA